MAAKLTHELRRALAEANGAPVPVQDDETQRVYMVVDQEVHLRAMDALQQQEDLASIRRGIDDMEAGRVVPSEEVDVRIRKKLGLPDRV